MKWPNMLQEHVCEVRYRGSCLAGDEIWYFCELVYDNHVTLCPSNHGSPIIKSIEIMIHGLNGIERDPGIPGQRCQEV
jgi:hypothetical protein